MKHIVTSTYEEMLQSNADVKKSLEEIKNRVTAIERDNYVPTKEHYSVAKSVARDISELRERIARIEGRS